ncbi:carnitine 3-dehydrogenase [Rhodobacterales bacterium HKCCE3408]|nr:carnitine 3-dehydrogenase [Rhodobacterales bacterium HKCCE3408]
MKAAIVGGGVIGGGWAARFLLNGWDVAIADPDPEAERKIGEVLANARRSLPALYDRALPHEGRLSFHADMAEAVSDADWVQESVPERLDLKHAVLGKLSDLAPKPAVIGSSTSGFKPSELNEKGARAIVAHPFNPVYLLPLVELVGDAALTGPAAEILRGIGMFPLTVRQEIDAHIADRLLEAVWRESLWLVRDEIATTVEIDEAIRMGFGIRWAQMGLFETYRIAGGEAGMAHFLAQFGPALAWPWTKLMDVPDLDDALVAKIAAQSDAQSGHMSIRQLERLRDDNVISLLRALKRNGSGAGGVIRDHEAALPGQHGAWTRPIPPDWADGGGNVAGFRFVEAAEAATARLLAAVAPADLPVTDMRLRLLRPLTAAGSLTIRSSLATRGAAPRVTHRIEAGDGAPVAVVTLFLAPPDPDLAARLETLAAAQEEDLLAGDDDVI